MDLATLTKLKDFVTVLEKAKKQLKDFAYGQRGRNENGRIGGSSGNTAPGNDPDNPRLQFPHGLDQWTGHSQ